MKEMVKLINPFKCKICGNNLYFITKYNRLIDYHDIFKKYIGYNNIRNYLYNQNIKFIKCIVCNKLFIIDWTNKYPKQLLDKSSLEKFRV